MKNFVLCKSVILYDPECLSKFGQNIVYIPNSVLNALFQTAQESSELAYAAREFISNFEAIRGTGSFKKGVEYNGSIIYTVYPNAVKGKRLEEWEQLVAAADEVNAKHNRLSKQTIIVSRDPFIRSIANDFVKTEAYKADDVVVDSLYKGYRFIEVAESFISSLFTNKQLNSFGLYPNEFAIFVNRDNPEHKAVAICKGDYLKPLDFKMFDSPIYKHLKLNYENLEQKMLLYLLLDEDIRCVTVTGISGKGKTIVTTDVALAALNATFEEGEGYDQFIYSKPITSVSKEEALGFFPGTVEEKLEPHVQSLYDAIESLLKSDKRLKKRLNKKDISEVIAKMIEDEELLIIPLAHIRGRNLRDKFSLLDEGQNTSNHMMKSFITRHMDSSKTIITGDIEQIDDQNLHKYNNGLVNLIEKGKYEPYIAHLTMDITPVSKRGKLATFGSKKL